MTWYGPLLILAIFWWSYGVALMVRDIRRMGRERRERLRKLH